MDGLTLLTFTPPAALLLRLAWDAGLTVAAGGADGDTLVVRGPQRAAKMARRLLARKADVLPLVRAEAELPRQVLQLAAELAWPQVMTVGGQPLGPGEAGWRRVVESPRLVAPSRGILLGGLKAALQRRRLDVPSGVSWTEFVAGTDGSDGLTGEAVPAPAPARADPPPSRASTAAEPDAEDAADWQSLSTLAEEAAAEVAP